MTLRHSGTRRKRVYARLRRAVARTRNPYPRLPLEYGFRVHSLALAPRNDPSEIHRRL